MSHHSTNLMKDYDNDIMRVPIVDPEIMKNQGMGSEVMRVGTEIMKVGTDSF